MGKDAHRTPVLTCRSIDTMLPKFGNAKQVFYKCENFQRVGAFKIRGALNAVTIAIAENPGLKAVVTHSSGNHAQAIALAAKLRGVEAHIVMPKTAPAVKRAAVEGTYGARVYICEPTLAAREATAQKVIEATNGVLIHPYNNRRVQEGQGTCGLELMEQTAEEPLDAVVLAVGGGGMFSGMASAIKQMRPSCRVFGAEPAEADDAFRSLQAGSVQPHLPGKPATIADGLLTTLGDTSFPVIQATCERIITVSESEIASAMAIIMERMKLVIEPSAAVPLAALMSDRFPHNDPSLRRIGVVLCGGNLDLSRIPGILALRNSPKSSAAPRL